MHASMSHHTHLSFPQGVGRREEGTGRLPDIFVRVNTEEMQASAQNSLN